MPKVLEDYPSSPEPTPRPQKPENVELRVPQIRILQVLAVALGPITRARIAERCGYKYPTIVHDSIGSSDPDKRAAAHAARQKKISVGTPLFDLGYVTETVVDVDGVKELGVEITPSGRKAIEGLPLYPPVTKDEE